MPNTLFECHILKKKKNKGLSLPVFARPRIDKNESNEGSKRSERDNNFYNSIYCYRSDVTIGV